MTPELQKELSDLLVMVIQVIVIPAISAIGYFVVQYFKAKTENIKNKEVRDALNDALSRLDLTAQTVVKEVNQTLRDKVVADGKLTKEAGRDLLRVAYARLTKRLPADAKAVLQNAFPDSIENEKLLQQVIIGKIEKTVGDTKLAKTAAECK